LALNNIELSFLVSKKSGVIAGTIFPANLREIKFLPSATGIR
jgi:hypothetical protein